MLLSHFHKDKIMITTNYDIYIFFDFNFNPITTKYEISYYGFNFDWKFTLYFMKLSFNKEASQISLLIALRMNSIRSL